MLSFVQRKIPENLVRKYGKHLNVGVYLKTPGHAVWGVYYCAYIVGWNKCRFGRGWAQFVHGNSLSLVDIYVLELANHAQTGADLVKGMGTRSGGGT